MEGVPVQGGIFTISLDFELYWGMRDVCTLDSFKGTLLGARAAIPRLLDLFSSYGVNATWATVGFLFHSDREELLNNCPGLRPQYAASALNPYPALAKIGNDEQHDPFHYGASLIKRIAATQGQEIASHTFSHYYCLEKGQSEAAFRADMSAAVAAARRFGVSLRSVVFPRNQCNDAYLPVLSELGFTAYRGNPDSWIWRHHGGDGPSGGSPLQRLGRLADAFLPLTQPGQSSSGLAGPLPINVPGNRFLRAGRNGSPLLDRIHIARIKGEMSSAARRGTLYHLWWHPHNFGLDTDAKLRWLTRILEHYRELRNWYGMQCMSMGEIADACSRTRARTVVQALRPQAIR